jgi:hypothetical protein
MLSGNTSEAGLFYGTDIWIHIFKFYKFLIHTGDSTPSEMKSIIQKCESDYAKNFPTRKRGLLRVNTPRVIHSTSLFSTKNTSNPHKGLFKKPVVLRDGEIFNNSRPVAMGEDYDPSILRKTKRQLYETPDLFPLPPVDMTEFNEIHFVKAKREFRKGTAYKSYGRTYNTGVLKLNIKKDL